MNSLNLWFTCVFLEKKKKKSLWLFILSDSIFVLLLFTTGYQDWKVKALEEKEESGKTLERKRKKKRNQERGMLRSWGKQKHHECIYMDVNY